MKENVFFLDHHQPEGGGGGADVSKHNVYEVSLFAFSAIYTARTDSLFFSPILQVDMIRALVQHLLRFVLGFRVSSPLDASRFSD